MPTYNPGSGFRKTSAWNPARKHPVHGTVQPHRGQDWAAPSGTPIPAAASGIVVFNGSMAGYGNTIVLEHQIRGDTVHTLYAHMDRPSPLAVRSPVGAREPVGTVGNTGVGTGPHLHFEVMTGGTPGQPNLAKGHATVDPETFDFPDEDSAPVSSSSWSYPFPDTDGEVANPGQHYEALGHSESGFYPVGANGIWHGGIHFDRGTQGRLNQKAGVRCIADGHVIAYRIDREYPTSEFTTGPATYSTGFVLVRHELRLPATRTSSSASSGSTGPDRDSPQPDTSNVPENDRAPDTNHGGTSTSQHDDDDSDRSLTFFSLYMHLQDWTHYQSNSEKPQPGYWANVGVNWLVGGKAVDPNPYESSSSQRGIRVRQGNSSRTPFIGWLPPGTRLTVEEGQGNWRRVSSIDQGAMLADPTQGPSGDAPAGWIFIGELDPAPAEPSTFDAVHVMGTPIQVKAGELMGYLGQYKRYRDTSPLATERNIVHVETFSCDDVETFIRQSRTRANDLPEEHRTLLLIEEGAQLVVPSEPDRHLTDAESAAAIEGMGGDSRWMQVRIGHLETVPRAGLGSYSDDTTRIYGSGSVLHRILDEAGNEISLEDFNALPPQMRAAYPGREVLVPGEDSFWVERAHLQGNPVLSGGRVPLWREFPLSVGAGNGPTAGFPRVVAVEALDVMVTEPDGTRWWQVEVGTEDGASRLAWAKEKGHAKVRLCSPWDWPGFDITKEGTSASDQHARSLDANGESQPDEDYRTTADAVDGSPLFQNIRDVMDLDGNAKVTRDEIRRALRKPWLAQALSHLIVQYESEWGGEMDKWTALNPRMHGELEDDWTEEKARIENLLWWNEVSGKHDFPADPTAYHFHPIALIANFISAPADSCDGDCLKVPAGQVTFDAEGNDTPGNRYYSRVLHWPGGASGVTLGRGYDMKERTQSQVLQDLLAAGVDTESARRFSGGAGLSGTSAQQFVSTHRDAYGEIDCDAQKRLFTDVTYPVYVGMAKRRYEGAAAGNASIPAWDNLDGKVRDIAVDLTYQQGSIWNRQMPYITSNDRESLARYIESTPELSQYENGRNRATYLRQ